MKTIAGLSQASHPSTCKLVRCFFPTVGFCCIVCLFVCVSLLCFVCSCFVVFSYPFLDACLKVIFVCIYGYSLLLLFVCFCSLICLAVIVWVECSLPPPARLCLLVSFLFTYLFVCVFYCYLFTFYLLAVRVWAESSLAHLPACVRSSQEVSVGVGLRRDSHLLHISGETL